MCRQQLHRNRMTTVAAVLLLLAGSSASGQQVTQQDEEICYNGNGEKVLMMHGGKDADLANWPYIVALRQKQDANLHVQKCTGSLLSPTWVLTAAHCVTTQSGKQRASDFLVSQALDQRDGEKLTGPLISVSKIETPPGQKWIVAQDVEQDIALLKLASPFPFQHTTRPIIADAHLERSWGKANTCVHAAGWGLTEQNALRATAPARLQELNLLIFGAGDCTKLWGPRVRSDQFCAGYRNLRKNACGGDSGGPLITRDMVTGALILGILHAGNTTCPGEKPNIYTRVSTFRNWIDQTMGRDP